MKIGYAFFPVVAVLAGCAAAPADHYQPLVLNQAAQERAGADDAATARIFVERARRIAKDDSRIGPKTKEPSSEVAKVDASALEGDAPLPALWSAD